MSTHTGPRQDAAALARLLAARAPQLTRELLPSGKRAGAEWVIGSLAGEPGQSCAIHLFGAKAGVWSDFATGEVGDALDLVAQVLYRGDKRAAMGWARAWLGTGDQAPASQPRMAAQAADRHAPTPDEYDDAAKRRQRDALALWLKAEPLAPDGPVTRYLAARGIDLAELGRIPASLRYHPGLYNAESRAHLPAMVAAITDAAGNHVATHRTWLAQTDSIWGKARLEAPKKVLGRYAGAAIRLWRGASGKPLAQAPAGDTVVIGEGIETCLSIALACPELRVLAAVSLANMARLVLPPAATDIILAADNDTGNDRAQLGLQRAIDHFVAEGRRVRLAMPPRAGADWNDLLRDGA